ncbi:MAG: fucose isomerase [Planctomycetaceae bacterium]|nr:fucose isomerase [Planctomycetaceae bacterium]
MSKVTIPKSAKPTKVGKKQVLLLASGDLRLSANQMCWPAQRDMEKALTSAVANCGYQLIRAHPVNESESHGFIASQKQGMQIFAGIDPNAKLIVAEAVWQYSHHVLAGLISHKGPICTIANWSGQWSGLVGMLNLNGSLTKAGVKYSTLWAEDFADPAFTRKLLKWLNTGAVSHKTDHVTKLDKIKIPAAAKKLGRALADELRRDKSIMGVFDEGCMGMFNAIIPDHLLNPTGVFKERLSQSALYHAANQVPDDQARAVYQWYLDRGMTFDYDTNPDDPLTEDQVLMQCRMYIAAVRLADEFGCDTIGIQYQQGLKDLLPASDLVEGTLNNADRPPVRSADGSRELYPGAPLPHFNEVDECAGLDALMTLRVHHALHQPPENTLHDIRWGDWDASGSTDEYVWVFEISGAAPPAHFIDGWAGAIGLRQPPMYFQLGGASLKGISRPGEIIWSRIYVARDRLNMDLGRAKVIRLPDSETQRRWDATTVQWPIMHAVTYGVTRDQLMARHQANHIHVAYANSPADADRALLAKAAMADAMGIRTCVCGTRAGGKQWAKR